MDTRIKELESDLDVENLRLAEAQNNLQKSERRIKEITYRKDEDRKNKDRMHKMVESLQNKVSINLLVEC